MTCSPTCYPPGACAASPASSNARCPTLGSRRALTATGPSRPSHSPKPSPSDEPDPARPITQRQIARLLAPMKIKPSSIRIGTETPRGYLREWFDDAFFRYLPVLIRNSATNQENQEVTPKNDPQQNGHISDRKDGLSSGNHRDVADVADRNGDSKDSKGFNWRTGEQDEDFEDIPR